MECDLEKEHQEMINNFDGERTVLCQDPAGGSVFKFLFLLWLLIPF